MFIGVSFVHKFVLGEFSLRKLRSSRKSGHQPEGAVHATAASRSRRILYLVSYAAALLAGIACFSVLSAAQRGDRGDRNDRPEITPQDKVLNKKKKGGEPRALGLLQLTANGKATLLPIAILINGRFYDAASYKASPVPMALESGTVYEGERTGSSLGLFTVNGALHSRDVNSSNPWIGVGQWLIQGTEAKKTTLTAEDVPVGLVSTDEPPRLTKSAKPPKDAATDSASANAGAPTVPASTPGSTPASKPADTSPSSPDKKPTDQTQPDQTKAGQSKPDAPKSDQAAPAAGEDTNSQAGDANRPKLRRGKPTEPLPADEEVPGYSKPGETRAAAAKTDSAAAASAAKLGTASSDPAKTPPQLVPAISDESGPDPRSFVYEWAKSEEDERKNQVVALAQQQLNAYLQERTKNSIAAKAAPARVGAAKPNTRKPAAKTQDLVLENLQIRTFDLWSNNQPVIVLTARAHPPLPAVGSPTAASPISEYSIALVARTDIYNNLHKLYVGVTDKYHLDVTPQLELIDAVDADGDGRGELLFRETSDAGSGYLIYRATGDTLWKMFDSLSPQ
jgi:hypothetical protein